MNHNQRTDYPTGGMMG